MVRASRRTGTGRLTLSGRFVLISLLGIALVAAGVVVATWQVMLKQSTAEGVATAETLADWITPVVPMERLRGRPDRPRRRRRSCAR